MNLGELETALNVALMEKSLVEYFTTWLNNALLELAADFELPALKTSTPTSLPVTIADWLFDLPEDFQKTLFRCTDGNYGRVNRYRTIQALDNLDLDHDEVGDLVQAVAVSETQIGVWPRANDTLHLWYYQRPALLVSPEDIPTCIPEAFHYRVILPKCVIKGLEHLQDQVENFDPKAIQLWQGKLAAGLNGSPIEGPGLKNYLSKIQGGPRRHGGRDPVGVRYYA